jgi:hypothetical protein
MRWSALVRSGLLAVVALAMTGATCYAFGTEEMEVKVPFPFIVNGERMPAGKYMINDIGMSVWLIRQVHGDSSTFVTTIPEFQSRSGEPQMRFQPYEQTHRLSSFWQGSDGHQIVRQ